MKKIGILLLILHTTYKIYAQTESISMGANYANQVFWSFPNGEAGTYAVDSWELAFRTGLQTSSIFINSANGVELYHDPNIDTSGWLTLDTAGLNSWQQLYNSDTSWEFGAFDRSSTGYPDFSWGDYDGTTHIVTGDSLYVIKFNGSVYKKLWIIEKNYGDWTFRYANLDNTGDQTVTIIGDDYPNKNFAYYSISNGQALNNEPDNTTWDIVFTRYLTMLPGDVPYLVTGVLNNIGVQAAEANGVDVATVNPIDYENSYTTNISEIGYDWKFFDMNLGQYVILDSLCYFVKSLNGNIYKIVFTAFDGSSTGNISFEQTYSLTAINPLQQNLESAVVYPNPVSDKLNLIFSAKKSLNDINLDLFNADGKEVFHTLVNAKDGLNQKSFTLPVLSDGLYMMRLASGSEAMNLKVILSR